MVFKKGVKFMDIECLEYFQKVARCNSISKVANMSHISQPALSQQMQKLEDSLGHELFVRSNRGVKLTQAGELVLKYADNIIRTYEKMLSELEKQQKREIKIEADITIATYCLPSALLKMQNNFPTHKYNLISGFSDQIEEDVLNDICEVGFIINHPTAEDLVSQIVINERVVLISPTEYNVCEKIRLEEVIDHPLIILKEKCIIKENVNRALNSLGYNFDDLNIIARLETTEAIKTLVKRGYGVGFVAYNAVKEDYYSKNLQVSRIEDYNLDYNVFMVNKASKILADETREFVERFKCLGNNICC